jgi:ubiquinone biosynthesis protein
VITPGQFFRVLAIQRLLIRHRADELLLEIPLFRSVRFLLHLLPWNWFQGHIVSRAERMRRVLEELGPIYVKFGQILSTRRDLLPDDIAEELAKLQDAVPPFSGKLAREIVERTYGQPIEQLFSAFNENPLASASIAQVHAATRLDGRQVIVKVVRPGIRKIIERDTGLMKLVAEMAERYSQQARRLRPTGVIAELEKTVLDELDLMREAANASQLRRNFLASDRIYVPEVHWDLTRQEVMVMERISGTRIDHVEDLARAGVDLRQLAEDGVHIFFTQVFRDHFFHADMHPGNLFVRPGANGARACYVPVDFGIMGSLSDFDQRYLAENFMAFLRRDYRKVAELHVESGWVPRDTRVDDFEFAIRTVCEPMFDRPIREISFGRLLLRLFQTAQRFHMVILPQLLLLQKTLVNIEGVGRQLYPDLDLWAAARQPLEQWGRDRAGVRRLVSMTRERAPEWAERLPELPGTVLTLLEKAKLGEIEVISRDPALRELRREMRRGVRQGVRAVIGAGMMIAAALVLPAANAPFGLIAQVPVLSWVLAVLGAWLMVAALRDR